MEGMIISTISTDFPHIVVLRRSNVFKLYYFPQSLYFVENRMDYSKSQRSRMSSALSSGERILFKADKNNIIYKYEKAIAVRTTTFSNNFLCVSFFF